MAQRKTKKVVVTRGGWRLWLMATALVAVPVVLMSFLFGGSSDEVIVQEEEISSDVGDTGENFRFVDPACCEDVNEEPDGMPFVQPAVYHPPVVKELPREFMIHTGKGLTAYVPYDTAIDIAVQTGIQLYAGRRVRAGYEISPAQARRLERLTDRLQITAGVVPGDRFTRKGDVWTFHPSPRR